jgi:uncharacterized membrane protein
MMVKSSASGNTCWGLVVLGLVKIDGGDMFMKEESSVRRITRIALLIALSAVGALIKVPSPTGTVALDSTPGYLGALMFGSKEGAIIAALGHLFSAATAGFPLSVPLHAFVAVQMALWAAAFGYIKRKVNMTVAAGVAAFLNGVVGAAMLIPIPGLGAAFFTVMVVPLFVASAINILASIILYAAITRAKGTDSK